MIINENKREIGGTFFKLCKICGKKFVPISTRGKDRGISLKGKLSRICPECKKNNKIKSIIRSREYCRCCRKKLEENEKENAYCNECFNHLIKQNLERKEMEYTEENKEKEIKDFLNSINSFNLEFADKKAKIISKEIK